MACCPQTRLWRTGRIRLPCPITACTVSSRPRRKSCCRRYSGAYRQAVPGKKPTHTGRDLHRCVGQAHDAHFNPRAPYGARPLQIYLLRLQTYFNPRAPYGARQGHVQLRRPGPQISIHAPHTGRDAILCGVGLFVCGISIHAPHTGRDWDEENAEDAVIKISIHAPHTGRDKTRSTG